MPRKRKRKTPPVSLTPTVAPPVVAPRVFKAKWSLESADEFREAMGFGRRRYIDVVERLAAIDAGKPDPGEWEEIPSAEEELIAAGAQEIADEVDKEIVAELCGSNHRTAEVIDADIEQAMRLGLGAARRGRIYSKLGERVKELLTERDRVERAHPPARASRAASATSAKAGRRPRTATSRPAPGSPETRPKTTRASQPRTRPRSRRASRKS